MPAIKIEGFSGLSPRTSATLLENNQAQVASNVKLQSGELRPWRKELEIEDPDMVSAATIYNMRGPSGSEWITWTTEVDVVTSPLGDADDYRIYYTGDGTPKKTNWDLAHAGLGTVPQSLLEMGVPAPAAKPSLSSAGGSGTAETRAYIYTYVSTFGSLTEESAPSEAETVSTYPTGATVTISGFTAPPAGNYNITHIRIYRAVTGGTSTVYKQVTELPIATTTYDDTTPVAALGRNLESLNYHEPPADLKGLVMMANGILAGFTGNEVYFSEPYLPHAWPSDYVLTTEFPVVGLGTFGTTLVVCTTKNPYLITGTHPNAMSQEKLSMTHACVAKKSIAFDQNGVLYASPYGMVAIGPGIQDVVTTPIMTQDEWQALNPSSLNAVLYGNFYLGFYNNGSRNAIVLSRNDTPAMTTFDFPATALFVDRSTGYVYANNADDHKIYQLDGDTANNTVYEWRSKRYTFGEPVNFSCLQANANFQTLDDLDQYNEELAAVNAENEALFDAAVAGDEPLDGEWGNEMPNVYMWNGSTLTDPPEELDVRSINIVIYADDRQVYLSNISSINPVRLPSGFKAYSWEFVVTGNCPVRSIAMATSIGELRQL